MGYRFLKDGHILVLVMDMAWIKNCFALLLVAAIPSCSIKEDRDLCPCLLTVDLSGPLDPAITHPSLWNDGLLLSFFRQSEQISYDALRYDEAEQYYRHDVEKGDVGVVGILGLHDGSLSGRTVCQAEGMQADPLYVSSFVVQCYGETAYTALTMRKQFTNVEITGLDKSDLDAVVTASGSSLDVLDCKSLGGGFRYDLGCVRDEVCTFRLPRQPDDNVQIMLYDKSGTLKDCIPLGRYMTACGYEWDALSLDDVSVNVDKITASVTVVVSDWSMSVEFPYVL